MINEHYENESEEFDDDQAVYYNKCIEKIENDDYSDIVEVDFENIIENIKFIFNKNFLIGDLIL